jgi:hypothetical protein
MISMRVLLCFLIPYFAAVGYSQTAVTDYSKSANWAVLPGAYPKSLLTEFSEIHSKDIDVFYVYPTFLLDGKDSRWNYPVGDSTHRTKVTETAVPLQASAWCSAGNLYVPFYQQAHIRSYYALDSGGYDALMLAYKDVCAAFEYYLMNYNHGKGIILAGHSQGSTHISMLLRDYFDGKELQNKLVAAYIPGIGIDTTMYSTISLMTNKEEIGGYVTWNTFRKKFDMRQYKWYKGKAVINPITWDKSPIATSKEHLGFLFSNGKMYRHSVTTHLADGVIWINPPKFPYRYLAFTMKNYHAGDINLFWEDIRVNSLLRVQKYLESTR